MDYFCCHNDRDAKENILNGSSRESNASSVGLGRLSVHVGRGGGRGRVGRGDSNHSGNYGSGRGYPADRFHGGRGGWGYDYPAGQANSTTVGNAMILLVDSTVVVVGDMVAVKAGEIVEVVGDTIIMLIDSTVVVVGDMVVGNAGEIVEVVVL